MTRRPHPYSADVGGVAASRRRAVTDRSALDAGSGGGGSKSGCSLWLLFLPAIVVAAVAVVGIAGGVVLSVVAS